MRDAWDFGLRHQLNQPMADRKAVFNGVKLMIDWKNPKSEYRENLHFFLLF